MLSFANITLCSSNIFNNSNVSALDYSSNVGIGFTFNPTLSISLSSNDLVIPNLVPGSIEDSNSINVSVATNAAYGYTLSANVGDSLHNNTNLTHTNNTSVFSSIATNADLASLDTDNTWGYTSKLSNETIWNNYNGLSNSSNAILLDNSNAADSAGSVDFKIAAKASNTQPSGVYTGTINFIAITKPTPMNLAESYFAHGKTRHNGYYTMQDMTTEICNDTEIIGEGSQTELIDIRDDKVYWATKLADNHCWMTQNLDLDLSHDKPLTSEDTDLNDGSLSGAYSENYKYDSTVDLITWVPKNNTKLSWANSDNAYSIDVGDWYWDGDSQTPYCDYIANTCENFSQTAYNTIGAHGHIGNYYNWSAAIASDNSSSLNTSTYDNIINNPQNSICPKNWRLPTISKQGNVYNSTSEFLRIHSLYKIGDSDSGLISQPLYLVRSGTFYSSTLSEAGGNGYYWSSTVNNNISAYSIYFNKNTVLTSNQGGLRNVNNRTVRCLAK